MKRILHIGSIALSLVLLLCFSAQAQAPEKPTKAEDLRDYVIQTKKFHKTNPPKGFGINEGQVQPAIIVGEEKVPVYPKFISFPTSSAKPFPVFDENTTDDGRQAFEYVLQHWYFIFDQQGYKAKYGELPTNLPNGYTPAQYAANPPAGSISEDLNRFYSNHSDPGQSESDQE
ncbi:MAG: hypothetical protein AAF570_02745 [Bacteroidota bacterium]